MRGIVSWEPAPVLRFDGIEYETFEEPIVSSKRQYQATVPITNINYPCDPLCEYGYC